MQEQYLLPTEPTISKPGADPKKEPRRPHVSHSAINWYLEKCGYYFEQKWIRKIPVPPTAYLHKGSSVHAGSEVNFKQKIKSFKDLPASQIQEATVAAFDDRVKAEGYMLTAEEEKIGSGIVLGRAKDKAAELALLYAQNIAPAHQPILVEEYQRIKLKDDLDLLVKLDLINDLNRIVDLKTGKRAMSQAAIDSDLQFSIYALAYRAINKKDPDAVVIENLVESPKNTKHLRFITRRTELDFKKVVTKINRFIAGTSLGVFLPAAKGSWFCNEDHCGYARSCKYYQFYKQGGGSQPVPFWMKFKRKKKEVKSTK